MGWFSSEPAERSDGETGNVSDAWVAVKTDDEGTVTDVTVGQSGSSEHDHYYKVDEGQSGSVDRVDWNKD